MSHAFEQLLALRADLEEALASARRVHSAPQRSATCRLKSFTARRWRAPGEGYRQSSRERRSPAQVAPRTPLDLPRIGEPAAYKRACLRSTPAALRKQAGAARAESAYAHGAAEAEKCLEAIWEQLIAAPPSRGRSMSTVVLQDTQGPAFLLGSSRVRGAKADQEAEDLRRAVVARALLAVATDQRKRSGDERACIRLRLTRGAKFPISKAASKQAKAREEYGSRRESWESARSGCFPSSRKQKNSSLEAGERAGVP